MNPFLLLQEILVVGIGRHVLRIDTIKVGKSGVSSAEDPLQCAVDKLISGVQLVGLHDGEVTDLSMCQWMTSRLVSASMDGTVGVFLPLCCFCVSNLMCFYICTSVVIFLSPIFSPNWLWDMFVNNMSKSVWLTDKDLGRSEGPTAFCSETTRRSSC